MTSKITPLIGPSARVGLLSFGGPAAQIALLHRVAVEENKWLDERAFMNALSFCMLLPGPEAMQLATYVGWKRAGVLGGLVTGLLFVLPGALIIAVLALLYAQYGTNPNLEALMTGIQATVVVIVLHALWRLSRKSLTSMGLWATALLSFLAIYLFDLPFPIILALAAIYGALALKPVPTSEPPQRHTNGFSISTVAFWLVLWLFPLGLLWLLDQTLLFQLGAFFAKLAVVTFGGAYAVLSYMAQEVVTFHEWLRPEQMVDALGLAETTPGPLILVTQFVAMVTGYENGQIGLAITAGVLSLWMTFVPCFLWIFGFAPHLDRLLTIPALNGALTAVSAAVVGVILNLSIWMALHIFFDEVTRQTYGPLLLLQPDPSTINWTVAGLSVIAAMALLWRKLSVPITILITVICAAILYKIAVYAPHDFSALMPFRFDVNRIL